MDVTPQGLLRRVQRARVEPRLRLQRVLPLAAEGPEATEEAVRAFRTRVAPRRALVRRTGEHHERARGVGAEPGDDVARLDDVVLALRHLLGAAVGHRLAVLARGDGHRTALVVVLDVDLGRVEPALPAGRVLAVVAVVGQHALREQALERLVELHQAEVAHHLGPEARVQQVQHRVLDPADVLVHRHPVVVAAVDHRGRSVRRAVAHVVPGRVDERVHRVGLAPRRPAALRARALQEGLVPVQRIAAAVRDQVSRAARPAGPARARARCRTPRSE